MRKSADWWKGFGTALALATGIALVVGAGASGAEHVARPGSQGFAPQTSREIFDSVVKAVDERYVDAVSVTDRWQRLTKAAAAKLDPYSYYLTAQERSSIEENSARGTGTGLIVARAHDPSLRDASLHIVDIRDASPAQRAGLRVGQPVLAINGMPADRFADRSSIELALNPPIGEKVELLLDRGSGTSTPQKVYLASESIQAPLDFDAQRVKCGEFYCFVATMRRFSPGIAERLRRALRDAHTQGIHGIVLDLRGNPGGELDEALKIADAFIANGILTRLRGRNGRILQEERATAPETDTKTPLVLLQDRNSASASELLAAALRDHGRATLVGERSFGKGSVQDRVGFADGSRLHLTIARYFSPQDHVIDGRGVEPDIHLHFGNLVLGAKSDTKRTQDPGVQLALSVLAKPS